MVIMRRAKPQNRTKYTDWGFLLPAMSIVIVMTQIPFLLTIIYSMLRWNLARPDLPIRFDGLKNYTYFLQFDTLQNLPEFYSILWQTILITASVLLICSIAGFFLSLLLNWEIPGINIARTLILAPFFVMSTASGVVWKTTVFNTTFGWQRVISDFFSLPALDFISYYPIPLLILLFCWKWLPFFVLVILAGLQGISDDLLDSAKVDGANTFQSIFQIKLPLIRNHIRVAVMLGLIFIIKEFGLILVTTAGGPGTRSYTLPYLVYMQVFNASNVGRAGALATITVILTLILVNRLHRSIQRHQENPI